MLPENFSPVLLQRIAVGGGYVRQWLVFVLKHA
jgi:hypothetical protein